MARPGSTPMTMTIIGCPLPIAPRMGYLLFAANRAFSSGARSQFVPMQTRRFGQLGKRSTEPRLLRLFMSGLRQSAMLDGPTGRSGLARSFDERPSVFSVVHPT